MAWVQHHERSPLSYGIAGFGGYVEVVPPNTPLPCVKSALMENALDYVPKVSFPVACRLNMLHTPVNTGKAAVLENVHLAAAGQAKFKVTMRIQKDLTGELTVRDTWTGSEVTIDFDSAVPSQLWQDDQRLISSKT